MLNTLSGASPSASTRSRAASQLTKCVLHSLVLQWRMLSSIVPETSPPSTCAEGMYFIAQTMAAAMASTRSPWTTTRSGRCSCTKSEKPITVLARTKSSASPARWLTNSKNSAPAKRLTSSLVSP